MYAGFAYAVKMGKERKVWNSFLCKLIDELSWYNFWMIKRITINPYSLKKPENTHDVIMDKLLALTINNNSTRTMTVISRIKMRTLLQFPEYKAS